MTEPEPYEVDPEEVDQPDPAEEQALAFDPIELPTTLGEREVDEADALEQTRQVKLDEDEQEF